MEVNKKNASPREFILARLPVATIFHQGHLPTNRIQSSVTFLALQQSKKKNFGWTGKIKKKW